MNLKGISKVELEILLLLLFDVELLPLLLDDDDEEEAINLNSPNLT
jgi:hypothetical protein